METGALQQGSERQRWKFGYSLRKVRQMRASVRCVHRLIRDVDQRTREIVEAAEMTRLTDCVRTTSISLTAKEMSSLHRRS